MKITDIKVYLPLGLLRIQTDAENEGLSDGCGDTGAEFIQQVYRPELLGQDPCRREVIWQRLMHLERLRYPPANVNRAVVDNALWDLAGKAAGMPVWKRLGAPVPQAPAMLPPWPGQVLTPLLEGRVTSVQPAVVVGERRGLLGAAATYCGDEPSPADGISGPAVWGAIRHAAGSRAVAQSLVAAALRRPAARPASAAPESSRAHGQSPAAPPGARLTWRCGA